MMRTESQILDYIDQMAPPVGFQEATARKPSQHLAPMLRWVAVAALIATTVFGFIWLRALDPTPPEDTQPVVTQPTLQASLDWTATGDMSVARADHTATLLADGKVLVTGGGQGGPPPAFAEASAELYDPSTGTWTTTGEMIQGRHLHTATLLPDGGVLVAGGDVSMANIGSSPPHRILASAELYDPSNGTWTATGAMNGASYGHTAILLLDGTVLVVGGMNHEVITVANGGVNNPAPEVYDPRNGTWTVTGEMIEPRAFPTATLLSDGKVLVAGGEVTYATGGDSFTNELASAELYDPSTRTWTATGNMTEARGNHTATLLADGRVLVTGFDSAELYDPKTGSWTATEATNLFRYTATLLANGRVLATGGGAGSAEWYDPRTGTWTATGRMINTRDWHTATLLDDGRVLVVGGNTRGGEFPRESSSPNGPSSLASAELYDPRVNSG